VLHALPSQALTSIWMSLILKPFAPDIIFANDRTQRRGFAFVGGSSTQGVHWRPEIRTFILHSEWKTALAVEPLAAKSPQNPQGLGAAEDRCSRIQAFPRQLVAEESHTGRPGALLVRPCEQGNAPFISPLSWTKVGLK